MSQLRTVIIAVMMERHVFSVSMSIFLLLIRPVLCVLITYRTAVFATAYLFALSAG